MREEEVERLNVENYKIDANFSRKLNKNGGVMILSRGDLGGKWVVLPHSLKCKLLEERVFEFCAFTFMVRSFKFVVVGLYRSPACCAAAFVERLNELIIYLGNTCDTIILAGDININVLSNSKEHKLFENMLISNNMVYLVDFPTRINNNSTKTAIDNFIIKKSDIAQVNIIGVVTLLSDHDGQVLELKNPTCPNFNNYVIKEQRLFSKDNLSMFSKLLEKESWLEVYLAPTTEKYNTFYNLFNFYFEQAFPKKIVKLEL